MPKKCCDPGCPRVQFGGGYCLIHQWKRQDKGVKKKKLKPGKAKKYSKISHALINLNSLLGRAVTFFNQYIRARDIDFGCISCGKKVDEAGHYFPAGSYKGVKFDEINVNGQCHECNCHKHGNLEEYRKGLIQRYGEEAVRDLEIKARETKKYTWSQGELQQIIIKYANK